ncbi:MAG: MmgE/PrpD family protein [Firmicutes bacterium]|nr:MmgE/PrpD family protein [Bacillota bacterium]
MSFLQELATKASAVDFAQLPGEVIEEARYCLLDALGCGLLGSSTPEGRAIVAALKELSGNGSVPVWGTNISLPAESSVMACGSFCHLRELDDVHYAIVHPGAVCVPVAVAVAQENALTYKDLLLAIVIGYEVMIRIAKSINFLNHRRLGWHATATCGSFGAAAAAAKLLRLDASMFTWALGICGSRTGGTWAFSADNAMSKRLHPGQAARDGLTSAYLAKHGITGPAHVLDAEDGGFFRVASQSWNVEDLTRRWGEVWAITEIEYKWYAACKSVHSPIEAARQIFLKVKHSRRPNYTDIKQITVKVNSTALAMAGRMFKRGSVVSAQLSIPYGVAVGLLGGEGSAADYTEDKTNQPEIYELAKKVKVCSLEEFDQLRASQHKSAAELEVEWMDGHLETVRVADPKGTVYNPLSREELVNKFLSLASPVLGLKQAERISEVVIGGSTSLAASDLIGLLALKGE